MIDLSEYIMQCGIVPIRVKRDSGISDYPWSILFKDGDGRVKLHRCTDDGFSDSNTSLNLIPPTEWVYLSVQLTVDGNFTWARVNNELVATHKYLKTRDVTRTINIIARGSTEWVKQYSVKQ